MPIPTPTEEVLAIRDSLAAKCNFDLKEICADLQKQQETSGRNYIQLPKRPPINTDLGSRPLDLSGGPQVENPSSPSK